MLRTVHGDLVALSAVRLAITVDGLLGSGCGMTGSVSCFVGCEIS